MQVHGPRHRRIAKGDWQVPNNHHTLGDYSMSKDKYRIQYDSNNGMYYAEEFKKVYPEDGTPIGHDEWVLMTKVNSSGSRDEIKERLRDFVLGPQTVATFDKDMNEL